MFDSAMIDLETGGLDPARSPILSISGVKFNLKERSVCPDFFHATLLPSPNRYWDEGTREWWMKKKDVLIEMMKDMEDSKKVLLDLSEWGRGVKHMWAKPTHFDHSFLQRFYHDHGMQIPFHYREARDLNTFIGGLFFPNEVPDLEGMMPIGEGAHNSLTDSLHQLQHLFLACDLKNEHITGL